MYFVYVIKNPEGRLYIGQTQQIEERLSAHNSGLSRWTKSSGPWTLVYQETLPSRSAALLREKVFKSGRGRDFLDSILTPSP